MFDGVTSISARSRLLIAIGGTLLCALATRVQAQSPEIASRILPPVRLDLLSRPPNECGFTLGDLLDQKLWSLVQHPLRLGALNQIGESMHRAPHPGVQFEVLTPGAGITLHFRWSDRSFASVGACIRRAIIQHTGATSMFNSP